MLYAADLRWWTVYGAEIDRVVTGERWTCADQLRGVINWVAAVDEPGLSTNPTRIHSGLNSGYQAIGLAYLWGAAKIILLGYDMQRGPNGESHHHGDHEGGLPNLGTLPEWARRMNPLAADLRRHGVDVVNASRSTAITCFERMPIEIALRAQKPALILHGMSGMGDCLHQRAIVKQLMQTHQVWLKTPWPQLYHDMPALHCLPVGTALRTQAKNEQRARYSSGKPPRGAGEIRAAYSPDQVRKAGSVLAAMSAVCNVPVGDFRMPVPSAWKQKARALLPARLTQGRAVLIYRPLVARTEWGGSSTRNPDAAAYAALFGAIRAAYFVVSVADLVPKVEWITGEPVEADLELHHGEADIEALAGLFTMAALVFSAPGFATILAQAVGTPAVTVFGGYEDARSFSAGARFTPWLAIEPIAPCPCWSHSHACVKTIDLPGAQKKIREFIDEPAANIGTTANATPLRHGVRADDPPAAIPAALL